MSTQKIIKEKQKRTKNDKNIHNVLGAELKSMRQKNSMTLKDAVEGICSMSYLSKIEHSNIEPNQVYITKICERMDLDPGMVSKLYKLGENVMTAIYHFFHKNNLELQKIYEEVYNFTNYRSEIIKLIFYIYHRSYDLAYESRSRLMKLYRSVNDTELNILCLLSSILDIRDREYKSAAEGFAAVLKNTTDDAVKGLCYEYLLEVYYLTNSRKFLLLYERICVNQIFASEYEKLEHAWFIAYKYMLYNGFEQERLEILERLKPTRYYRTICLLEDIYALRIPEEAKLQEFVSPFYEMLYLLYTNERKFNIRIEEMNSSRYSSEEMLYLKFLQVKKYATRDRVKEYCHSICGSTIDLKCVYLIKIITRETVKYYYEINKYKPAANLMQKVEKTLTELEKI